LLKYIRFIYILKNIEHYITNKKIKKYFPENYTAKQMEDVIYKLLEDLAKNK